MAQLLFVKVKEGLLGLRNPLDGILLSPGVIYEVPSSQFWLRRLEQGDVFEVTPAQVEKPKKVKEKKGE